MSNDTTNKSFSRHLENNRELFIKTGVRYEKLDLTNLLFVQTEGKYIALHFKDGKRLLRVSLVNFLKESSHLNLIRIHKGFAINTDYINSYTSQEVTVLDNEIPIGRSYKGNWVNYLNKTNKKNLGR
ncbi:LytTR family transcriptional regulator [Taibaiella lutea]|uniref:LytTR family transcriptional regulator n=1 Tax=Taibaiella lutea TaxID=2608001 RepID=A0A5M6CAM2_9BACT|nr:LytTR family DNA-binding domain-containing protein [Taibaiella lutea]KAA5532218.1 LytTR family transcriptional regulator [Taibaiella lutea]